MTTDDLRYIEKELNKSRDELLEIVVALKKQADRDAIYRIENERALTAMAKDYQNITSRLAEVLTENKALKETLTRIAEQDQLKTRTLFGRGTEKLSDILHAPLDKEEFDEDQAEPSPEPYGKTTSARDCGSGKRHGKKHAGKREEDLSGLPRKQKFILDIKELDQMYGEGNWRIAHWHRHTTVEFDPAAMYALDTFTPVVSVGLEHELHTAPVSRALLRGSLASPSLAAQICYQKFFLALPLYRQEQSFANFGLTLSRQTMCNWVLRFAFDYFGPIYDHLKGRLLSVAYHQCDETPLRVLRDGRPAGAKSYMWVHITSELLNTSPIILFCYELTRGTDHLRKFYQDFQGFITCDAYCSYQVLEKEKQEVITVCGCMMHLRRRFANSLALIDKTGLSEEKIRQLPEAQALILIGKIYDADEALKNLSAEERRIQRETTVRPLVEEYYAFTEGIDCKDPLISNRLKDALNYSRNQKEYLCRFLEDGNIPIDDGATERHIRPFAIGRNNFLFCNTVDGAEAMGILYSIVETAKANKVNVYYYLRYILEMMPKHMEDTDRGFLDSMMPWSEEYREYEQQHTLMCQPELRSNEYTSPPKTPHKHHAA